VIDGVFEFAPLVYASHRIIAGREVVINIRGYRTSCVWGWVAYVDDGYMGVVAESGTEISSDEAMYVSVEAATNLLAM
jgi:hypothetical protein